MEEERRKRKLENEEENEEQKMEEFFALVKRTKDVRDLLFKENPDEKIEAKNKSSLIWNPTFQPEDFIDCGDLGKSDLSGPSKKEKELIEKREGLQEATTAALEAENNEEKEKESEDLDLNLTL
ncbi:protein NIM1-INTERACTING 1-like [Abrus precatorius]|uniref:Protein NIM1-INTERACTING 1-like n=1 Tax=Abrus precatorius TaxID=3816 RepID=A0A8B8LD94_ABRPR|nr:protein NIM1-INTERACTING 1-like [Abrus precatorius]